MCEQRRRECEQGCSAFNKATTPRCDNALLSSVRPYTCTNNDGGNEQPRHRPLFTPPTPFVRTCVWHTPCMHDSAHNRFARVQKQRTSVFSLFRKKNQPSTSSSSFTNLAVVRVHQNGATEKWVAVANPTTDRAQKQRKGRINMNICGGYQSEYSLLATLIGKCPLLIVATGAGAGLVLDVVSYIKGKNVAIAAENHVDIVFSTWSLPLLQVRMRSGERKEKVGVGCVAPHAPIKTRRSKHADQNAPIETRRSKYTAPNFPPRLPLL